VFDFHGDKKYTQCGVIQEAVRKGGDEKFYQVIQRVEQYLNANVSTVQTLKQRNAAVEPVSQQGEHNLNDGGQTLSRPRQSQSVAPHSEYFQHACKTYL